MKFAGLFLLYTLTPVVVGIAFMVASVMVGVRPADAQAFGALAFLCVLVGSAITAMVRSDS